MRRQAWSPQSNREWTAGKVIFKVNRLPIVRDTCRAIFRVLKDEHMTVIFMFNVLVNSVNSFIILV